MPDPFKFSSAKLICNWETQHMGLTCFIGSCDGAFLEQSVVCAIAVAVSLQINFKHDRQKRGGNWIPEKRILLLNCTAHPEELCCTSLAYGVWFPLAFSVKLKLLLLSYSKVIFITHVYTQWHIRRIETFSLGYFAISCFSGTSTASLLEMRA